MMLISCAALQLRDGRSVQPRLRRRRLSVYFRHALRDDETLSIPPQPRALLDGGCPNLPIVRRISLPFATRHPPELWKHYPRDRQEHGTAVLGRAACHE